MPTLLILTLTIPAFSFSTKKKPLVVYHLQGEADGSTFCAAGKQNLPNGKFRLRD